MKNLQEASIRVRERIIKMSGNGGCFLGASLSAADIIVYLYSRFLNLNPQNLQDPGRDYFFLSKGHDVPALYATLVEMEILEPGRLAHHLSVEDHIYWHPNTQIPGIEFHSGSLGHLPSVSLGVALDIKMRKGNSKVVCLLGDGELNEGSCWEAFLVASAKKLDNLYYIIDRNHFQANMATEKLIPLEPLIDKFLAFGASVKRIDGHDFDRMEEALALTPFETGKINVLIADTLRGKGLPSIEGRADRWFCNFTQEEISSLLEELKGNLSKPLKSETLLVR